MGIAVAVLAKKAVDDMVHMAADVARGKPGPDEAMIMACLFSVDMLVEQATDYLTNELVEEFNMSREDAHVIVCGDEWQKEILAVAQPIVYTMQGIVTKEVFQGK